MPAEPYAARSGIYDEALHADGRARAAARAAMAALDGRGPAAARDAVRGTLRAQGVTFSSVDGDPEFLVDPVPRVISAEEWAPLEAGLSQRVRALNRFLADAYGESATTSSPTPTSGT